MIRQLLWVSALATLLLAPIAGARAQSVEEAQRLYLAASFQEAIPAFEAVLRSESATRSDVVSAHRHLAALHEMQGASAPALAHARAAVALDPSATAPEGAPPEVTAVLDRARDELGGAADLLIDTPRGALAYAEPGVVRAHVVRAPDGLVAGVRLSCEAGGDRATVASGAPPEVTAELTPRVASVRCEATAATAAGVVLLDVSQALSVEGARNAAIGGAEDVPGAADGGDDGDDAPIWPWVVGGAGALVLAGVVVAILLVAGPDQASFGGARVDGW